jgi:hypothetical protein
MELFNDDNNEGGIYGKIFNSHGSWGEEKNQFWI